MRAQHIAYATTHTHAVIAPMLILQAEETTFVSPEEQEVINKLQKRPVVPVCDVCPRDVDGGMASL